MRTERRKSGSERGDEKLASERQHGAHRLLNLPATDPRPEVLSNPPMQIVTACRSFLAGPTGAVIL